MRCPTLSELPPPPPGKTGWPWTEEGLKLPDTMPNGSAWPRVSVVTPSYNQGQFIEETIRSVLLQGYPDLEYIIIDGGSTDGSVDIIRKYEHQLAYWVSESDKGQSDAINKGWCHSRSDIIAWLNSDDTYMPGTLHRVSSAFITCPNVCMVYGSCNLTDEKGHITRNVPAREFDLNTLLLGNFIPQLTVFLRRHVIEKVGLLDTSLHYTMDYDLWLRAAKAGCVIQSITGDPLANYRLWSECKSINQYVNFAPEFLRVLQNFFKDLNLPKELSALQGYILSHCAVEGALVYYKHGNVRAACSTLRRSLRLHPVFTVQRVLYIIKRVLQRHFLNALQVEHIKQAP